MKCKICGNTASLFGKAKILCKYPAEFYQCAKCGFMQTESPYWLEEAYSNAITKSDVGLVNRNFNFSNMTKNLILTCLDPMQKFLDYGGGYGLFVRLMRDQGFDFYRHDPLCENLFARGFDAHDGIQYELLTAWEVFEHLVDPLAEIEKMLQFSDAIFYSTLLLPTHPLPLDDWWYYGLEHGQHISFYSRDTIKYISQKFDLNIYYSSENIHFVGRREINATRIRAVFDDRLSKLKKTLSKSQPASLLERDFEYLTGKKLH